MLACLFTPKENPRRRSRSIWWEPGWEGGALPPVISGKGRGSPTEVLPCGGVIHWGGESLGLHFPPSLVPLGMAPLLLVSGCENPISLLLVAACNAAARVAVASFPQVAALVARPQGRTRHWPEGRERQLSRQPHKSHSLLRDSPQVKTSHRTVSTSNSIMQIQSGTA